MFFDLIKEIKGLRLELNTLLSNVFDSVKEINRLRKETNKLLSKGILNIETFSELRFSGFKTFATRSALGSSNSRRNHCILKLLVAS